MSVLSKNQDNISKSKFKCYFINNLRVNLKYSKKSAISIYKYKYDGFSKYYFIISEGLEYLEGLPLLQIHLFLHNIPTQEEKDNTKHQI